MKPMKRTTAPHTLIIGYGNTLRQDDGVGYRMAETIDRWDLPGVISRSVHQLTPDLAAELASVQRAIFIDAFPWDPTSDRSPAPPASSPLASPHPSSGTRGPHNTGHTSHTTEAEALYRLEPLDINQDINSSSAPRFPSTSLGSLGHSSNPRSLLLLAHTLYGATCEGWWLLIPGQDFGFGEDFSPLTQAAQQQAIDYLRSIL